MSLTSFLNIKEVKEKFLEEFPKLFTFRVKTPLLAPPLTNNYQLVGTAFDYLLRFYIKLLNPNAIESSWVLLRKYYINHLKGDKKHSY